MSPMTAIRAEVAMEGRERLEEVELEGEGPERQHSVGACTNVLNIGLVSGDGERWRAFFWDLLFVVDGDGGGDAWIQAGVSASKLVLGLPFYGYAWTLVSADDNGIFASANGAAISSNGAIAYSQILDFISQNSATTVYNSTFVTNYCYSGTTWIGYDDTNSTSTKVTYAKGTGLLGYFAWQIGQDPNFVLSQAASSAWGASLELRDQM
ncbi:hypothetical protein SO802_000637 [Lithocarpus litseifolius]|uniref:GH18 domain-containing protein n=1 Tax=Lithocarpus litseifolius TaxID=425828 RepID=A0AAW2DVJ0_9ROSI